MTDRGYGFNAAEPSSQPTPRDEELILPDDWEMDTEPHEDCDCAACMADRAIYEVLEEADA